MNITRKRLWTLLLGCMMLGAAHAETETNESEPMTGAVQTATDENQQTMEDVPTETTTLGTQPQQVPTEVATPQPPQGRPAQLPDWTQDLMKRVVVDGYAQGGFNYEHTGGKDNNSFNIKRAFLIVAAPITDRWFAMFMYDFSSVVHEYWTSYRFTNNKAFNARIGQFKHAYSIENAMSPTELETIDVCSEGVTYLAGCGSDRLMGTQYGRDLGMEIFGETNNGKYTYRLGIMNGQGVNQQDGNAEKDFIAKLEYKPIPELTIAATGQLGRGHAVDRSAYIANILPGQDYKRNRWSAGFFYKTDGFRLRAEYVEGRDGDVTSRGAYATTVIPVAKQVNFVGSYDFFNYNVKEHMHQHKAVAGLEYWFYKRCRIQLQYVYKNASLQDFTRQIQTGPDTFTTISGKEFKHGANHALLCQMQIRLR